MYWSLLCRTPSDIPLGCTRGEAIYSAFSSAAQRGVKIYFLQDASQNYTQLRDLAASNYNVEYRVWNAEEWYGNGIMHQKLWVVDGRNVYLGSSNMDWLSLSQVKELGVGISDSSVVGGIAEDMFDDWYDWAGREVETVTYFNSEYQLELRAPCWTGHVEGQEGSCEYPFPVRKWTYNRKDQRSLKFNGNESSFFISRSPFEIASDGGYTEDLNGIISTIRSAEVNGENSTRSLSDSLEMRQLLRDSATSTATCSNSSHHFAPLSQSR